MEKILLMTLLHDFYGELLTDKQRQFFELHYLEDLSLSEIGGQYGISPQAVGDVLKRTEINLTEYEQKLKLVEKHLDRKADTDRICVLIDGVISDLQKIKDAFASKLNS